MAPTQNALQTETFLTCFRLWTICTCRPDCFKLLTCFRLWIICWTLRWRFFTCLHSSCCFLYSVMVKCVWDRYGEMWGRYGEMCVRSVPVFRNLCLTERYAWLKGMLDWKVCLTERYAWLKGMLDWRVCLTERYAWLKGMFICYSLVTDVSSEM